MYRGMKDRGGTGEVADGDGDAGDGNETKVIESVEVSDGLGERRVPIYYRILWLRRCCYVCIHFISPLSSLSSLSRSLCLSPRKCKSNGSTALKLIFLWAFCVFLN